MNTYLAFAINNLGARCTSSDLGDSLLRLCLTCWQRNRLAVRCNLVCHSIWQFVCHAPALMIQRLLFLTQNNVLIAFCTYIISVQFLQVVLTLASNTIPTVYYTVRTSMPPTTHTSLYGLNLYRLTCSPNGKSLWFVDFEDSMGRGHAQGRVSKFE